MTRKLSGLLIYSNLKDGSLQQFKGIQRSKQVSQRGTICQQMGYVKGAGVGPRGGAPCKKFYSVSPHPDQATITLHQIRTVLLPSLDVSFTFEQRPKN